MAPVDAWIGQTLGQRYRLESLLAIGGESSVYRGVEQETSYPVAIKLILTGNSGSRRRLQEEIKFAQQVQHPRLVQILDHGRTPEGIPFLVMELIDGSTLDGLLQQRPPIPVLRTLKLAEEITAALQVLHERGHRIHRDLNPGNIFVVKGVNGQETIKLGDLGMSEPIGGMSDSGIISHRSFVGTPAYGAPEQFRGGGTVDARSDLYSLGCLLYELLSGSNPFGLPPQASIAQWMHVHLAEAPKPFPKELRIPLEVEKLVFRCLEKDPTHRFASAADLNKVLADLQKRIPPPSPVWARWKRWWWGGVALLALGVGLLLGRPSIPDPSSPDLLQQGMTSLAQGDYEQALIQFESAARLDPEQASLQAGLAIALRAKGEVALADQVLSKAQQLDANHSMVHTALGLSMAQQGSLDQGIQELELAVQLDPTNTVAQTALENLRP